jgi:hypothetical protein
MVLNDNSKCNSDENSGDINNDSDHYRSVLSTSGHDNESDSYKKGFSHSDIVNQGTIASDDKTSTCALSRHMSKDATSNEFKHTLVEDAGADFDVSKETPQRSVSFPRDDSTKAKPFSKQLYCMLNSKTDAGSQAVQWLPDGHGFVIRNQKQFEQLLSK